MLADSRRNHTRCGVFYFSIPNNDVRPNLLTQSPVLQRAGVSAHFEQGMTIDAKTFSRARVAKVGKSDMYKKAWGKGERVVEVIGGCKAWRGGFSWVRKANTSWSRGSSFWLSGQARCFVALD